MRLFLWLCLAFVLVVPLGTVSHECGHWIAACALGFRPVIHYASCSYGPGPTVREVEKWVDTHPDADSAEIEQRWHQAYVHDYSLARQGLIGVGGPAQTILAGLLGIAVLEARRRRRKRLGLSPMKTANSPTDWLWVFVAFFLSREVLNVLSGLISTAWRYPRPVRLIGDEIQLARSWGLPEWSVALATAGFTGLLLLAVMLRHIPRPERGPFLLAGVVGGAVGVLLWFWWPGPVLMP